MPGLVTEAAAAQLRALLARRPTTLPRPTRVQVPGKRSVFVKCTSATAIGGTDPIGAECYPAAVMGSACDVVLADQEQFGDVWLTVISSGASTTPTANQWYEGLLSGYFDPDPGGAGTDNRPRVFAVPGSASSITHGTQDLSGTVNITADNTYTVGASISIPSAGDYQIYGQITFVGQISATTPGSFSIALGPSTGGESASGSMTCIWATGTQVYCTLSVTRIITAASAFTLELRGLRYSGPTWTTSNMVNTGAGLRSNVSYIKLS